MSPVLNTIAFGGVATGSMKAQDAARVNGRTKCVTAMPISSATAAKIGTSSAVLAVLLDSSVRKITKSTIAPTMNMRCISEMSDCISNAR